MFLGPACPLLSLGPPGRARVSEEHRSWRGGAVVGGSGQWLAGQVSGWRVGSVVGGSGQWLARGGQWLAGRASGWRVGPVVGDGWPVPCSMFPP